MKFNLDIIKQLDRQLTREGGSIDLSQLTSIADSLWLCSRSGAYYKITKLDDLTLDVVELTNPTSERLNEKEIYYRQLNRFAFEEDIANQLLIQTPLSAWSRLVEGQH